MIALLLIDSDLAISAGFALSVLATGGLILLAPMWSAVLQRRGVPAGWADLLAIPVAAQVVTMPVIVLISGSISVVGVLANLLVAPVVAPALMLGMLCALAGPWWPGRADLLAHVVAPLLNWIAWVAHTLARWPTATVPWPATPAGATVLTAGTVARGAAAAPPVVPARSRSPGLVGRGARRGPGPGLGARMAGRRGGCWSPARSGRATRWCWPPANPARRSSWTPARNPGLVDGCLSRLGIGSIALVVLTHLHADHVDGLPGALDGRSVGAIAVGPGREPAAAWRDINRAAADRAVPVVQFRPGDVLPPARPR